MKRYWLAILPLLGALATGVTVSAQAQNYPNRPISLIVPFAPGGLTEVPVRVLAAVMQQQTGATFVVENKTGASGVVGASYVWRAEPRYGTSTIFVPAV